MIYYVSYLKDSIGNNYLGISIPNGVVDPFLSKLRRHLSESDYDEYTRNQQNRDHGSYHITVINVMDYNSLSKKLGVSEFVNSLERVFDYPIDDLKMMGVGSASRNENKAYFIVCKSEKLESIRNLYNLPDHDFHITIGFKWKDVFGVRKNEVLGESSEFIKLLRSEFYKKENFNFLKKIENYKANPEMDIIPIDINDNFIKVYSDNLIMDIGYLEDINKFWVMASYKSDKEPKRLPITEILKIRWVY